MAAFAAVALLALATHVRTFAYFGLNGVNAQVPAAAMTRYADIVEDDGYTAEHAEAFKRAGGGIALAYTDPTYAAYCPPPFVPPAGRCRGPIADHATAEGAYLHDASGARVRRFVDPHFQYQEIFNLASPAAHAAYAEAARAVLAHAPHLDGFFADDSGSPLGSLFYGFSGRAVELASDAAYLAAERAMLAAPGKPVLVNGGDPVTWGPAYGGAFLRLPYVMGQTFEGCFNNGDSGLYTAAGDRFRREANGLLAVAALRKLAVCLPTGPVDPARRLYAYASFLLAYDPPYTVYGMMEKLRDGVAIDPETALVPSSPRRSADGDVDRLRAGDLYVREFAACALGGRAIGPCAAVVNPSGRAVPLGALASRYRSALVLDDRSPLGGGRARFGAAVPATLAPASAAILAQRLRPGP